MKHHPEPLTNKTAIGILDSFGVLKAHWWPGGGRLDYPMRNLLVDVLKPAAPPFGELLRLLEQWRNVVIAHDEAASAA